MGWLNRLRSNAGWFYAAEAFPRLVAILIIPIWSARVAPEEYARWVLALTTAEILRELSGLGLSEYLTKVVYRYHDERVREYFGMGAGVMLGSTLVTAISLAAASPWLSRLLIGADAPAGLFAWLALYIVVTQVTSLALLWAGSRVQYRIHFTLLALRTLLTGAFLLFFLLVLHSGFYSWVWGTLCAESLVAIASVWFLREIRWRWRPHLMRFGFRFSLPFLATNLFLLGQDRVGRYVLGASGLTAGVGLYGMAQSFALNYGAAVRPVKVVALQMLGHELEQHADTPYYLEFFHGFVGLALAAAFLVALFLGDVMRLFTAAAYHPASLAVPLLVFAAYHQEVFSLYHSLMFRHFRVWFQFFAAATSFVTIAAVALAIAPRFGFAGAALAQLGGTVAMVAFAHIYAGRVVLREFRFGEKTAFMAVALGVSVVAEVRGWPVLVKVVMVIVLLPAYLLYYWRRRDTLFPRSAITLSARLRTALASGRT